jgi:hypothetical protein
MSTRAKEAASAPPAHDQTYTRLFFSPPIADYVIFTTRSLQNKICRKEKTLVAPSPRIHLVVLLPPAPFKILPPPPSHEIQIIPINQTYY